MSAPEHQEIVSTIVVQVTQELFNAYDVHVQQRGEPCQDDADEILFAGVVGFTGRSMRGTLVFAPTRTLLERSHPTLPCEFRDWAGELANQLLGRIKNRLRAHGVDIYASTPVVLRGHYLASVPRGEMSLRCFAASPGHLQVWFDAELEEGVSLTRPAPAEDGPREGDTILF